MIQAKSKNVMPVPITTLSYANLHNTILFGKNSSITKVQSHFA